MGAYHLTENFGNSGLMVNGTAVRSLFANSN